MNITLSNFRTCDLNNVSVKAVMDHFNKTCKTFTAVNSFKYQLQHYLLHDVNNANLLEDKVQQLTSIIIGLQAAGRFLQEIAITEVNMLSQAYDNNLTTGHDMCEVHS